MVKYIPDTDTSYANSLWKRLSGFNKYMQSMVQHPAPRPKLTVVTTPITVETDTTHHMDTSDVPPQQPE